MSRRSPRPTPDRILDPGGLVTIDRFDLGTLRVPVIQAPMAGGPSTPALAAAVSESGGLGFLAAGYLTAERVEADIAATRHLTLRPFGVNLFVPQPSVADPAQLAAYREALTADAARYGVEPGHPRPDDDGWDAKLDVLLRTRPALASFTFGSPDAATVSALQDAGIAVAVTVTTPKEASEADAAGADLLVVQGPEAGGHRGTFDPAAPPATEPLDELLAMIRTVSERPIVAAGGVASAADVGRVLAAGAVAAQAGTAFLRADEAGTRGPHRDALASGRFTRTEVTTAFSGRPARGLVNAFLAEHRDAPLGYPEVNQLTAPIRAAAAAAGDADRLNLWAGIGFARAAAAPAAQIVEALAPAP
ncbi:nitronate monooxygenase [Agromyces sp. G08B096]|uniref:Probable nitronate monooxygenase n=1 Tax=Agromyces sp. G08B096 TaxID=3156399 RepID=A0AAU7W9W8_9MICO